jgi:hypothetical protein
VKEPIRERTGSHRFAPLAAALAMVGVLLAIYLVVRNGSSSSDAGRRGPFDPATTDVGELRRVTEAVSRIINAPREHHENAVQGLESLLVRSAGASDLREACINTYRSTIRADELRNELRALVVLPDGGTRRDLTVSERARAEQLQHEAVERIELANQSRERCHQLFEAAASELGLAGPRTPRR